MAFFDGPVVRFAEKFCEHLDARVEARYKECEDPDADNWKKMKSAIIGETLSEISTALKTIAGL